MDIYGVSRVSIAVRDLPAAIAQYEKLGLRVRSHILDSPRGLGLQWVELGNESVTFLELLAPTSETSALARFLDRHGEGVYQIRLRTDAVDPALDTLEQRGVQVVRDSYVNGDQPRLGWIHPSSTHGVLFELAERES